MGLLEKNTIYIKNMNNTQVWGEMKTNKNIKDKLKTNNLTSKLRIHKGNNWKRLKKYIYKCMN